MLYLDMDIQTLIKKYQTPINAQEVIRCSNILLLAGVSGAGKDSIKYKLTSTKKYGDIISHTTRPPRSNNKVSEKSGEDYYFTDVTSMARMLENKEFIEAKIVHGTLYGTSLKALEKASKKGIAVTDVDVQGVEEYKNIASSVKAVFILPPNYEEWIKRLKRRYLSEQEYLNDWPKRRNSAIKEISMALKSPHYYFIVNNNLDDAVKEIRSYSEKSDYIYNDEAARTVARGILEKLDF